MSFLYCAWILCLIHAYFNWQSLKGIMPDYYLDWKRLQNFRKCLLILTSTFQGNLMENSIYNVITGLIKPLRLLISLLYIEVQNVLKFLAPYLVRSCAGWCWDVFHKPNTRYLHSVINVLKKKSKNVKSCFRGISGTMLTLKWLIIKKQNKHMETQLMWRLSWPCSLSARFLNVLCF